jgi:hypothetical protein
MNTQNQALNAIFLTRLGDNPAESQKLLHYLSIRGVYRRVITYIFKFHSSNNPYPLRCGKEARRTELENLINRSQYYVRLAMLAFGVPLMSTADVGLDILTACKAQKSGWTTLPY